jgi:predicted AlkP superfamily pyrophosphatase or phosphodiesterase
MRNVMSVPSPLRADTLRRIVVFSTALASLLGAMQICSAAPTVLLISLDGMTPRFVDQYLQDGTLSPDSGIGRLVTHGVAAKKNTTISPSLTAPGHTAIATGSIVAHTDVVSNTFHLLASPIGFTISGFGAPIGGYQVSPLAESLAVTAEPLWNTLRLAGKKVVAATFAGADGVDVKAPGVTSGPVLQPAAERSVDYTVPFGSATSPFQKGFQLNAANFAAAPTQIVADLAAMGHPSYSPALQANLESFATMGLTFNIRAVALDTTNDGTTNYDTIVIYNDVAGQRIVGPFTAAPLGTGPAYIKPGTNLSAPFFFEGNTVINVPQKAGVRYFVSALAPDLSTVRIARTSVSYIGRQFVAPTATQVLADIADIHNNVGFWQPSPDFRIVEKIDAVPSTFANFPDLELEAIYEELVNTWVPYQTKVALRAISQNPTADLVMTYIEQPDGSFHQFLLTDPRQPTDPTNPNTILAGQDSAKITRYQGYLKRAYQTADAAVEQLIQASGGVDASGRPNADIIVISDHGFSAFHTAVNITSLLTNIITSTPDPDHPGNNFPITTTVPAASAPVRAYSSGPAVNVYFALSGREFSGATVSRTQYVALQNAVAAGLQGYLDMNANYTNGAASVNVFEKVYKRPLPANIDDPSFGTASDSILGQDSGDVFALMTTGYNFDGTQSPVVARRADDATASAVLSVPNFYGAHGYDPANPEMSAIFYAAGPDFAHGTVAQVRNIDIAPTILRILGVAPATTVDGTALTLGVATIRSGFVRDRRTLRYVQTITLQNQTAAAVPGPIYLAFDNLSGNATLANKDGDVSTLPPMNSPYITVVPTGGTLGAGLALSVNVQFTNSNNGGISYDTRVISGVPVP